MKKITSAIIGITTLTFSINSFTETGYAGNNIGIVKYSENDLKDASVTSVIGRLGVNFSENFSGEIRLGTGIQEDTINVSGIDVDFEIDSLIGGYLRGDFKITEAFFPYAVLGYTKVEGTASIGSIGVSDSGSDVSFGIGADIKITDTITINAEYINYYDEEEDGNDIEFSGLSLGLAFNF